MKTLGLAMLVFGMFLAVVCCDKKEPTEQAQQAATAGGTGAKELTLDLGNKVTLKLVLIPAGTFTMGSNDGDSDEKPPHEVRISKPFYMGKFEVTNRQYRNFKRDHNSGDYNGHSLNGDDQPVVNVNWYDAQRFCVWLSRQSNREVRLPSEAEWEYVARGGDGREFPWGNTWPPRGRAGNYADEAAKEKLEKLPDSTSILAGFIDGYRDGYAMTAPVGQFEENPYGLYDLGGNAWEWCADAYHEGYAFAPTDGRAWITQGDLRRPVRRGGAWTSYVRAFLRSPGRLFGLVGFRQECNGFRVVVSASAAVTP